MTITNSNIAPDQCDDTCEGSTNVVEIKQKMIAEDTAASLSEIFKALGDPTRIKIIFALLQSELCVHDLTLVLEMGQSAVSHQLRYLRNLRIVKRRKVGKTVYYSLDDAHIEQIFSLTLQHITHN
ncbi:metalloregulator ArsR/SmtB family transcription factor [Paenibacillus chondroitinus]|uniref:Metalloregulator ArsR/SmtB family transcription factor n=1 Tax=Paenibacillus chondroitinus TaxID=59842 RepID=A0ABU6DGI9_9BACL|nr:MULTISPECIES: metalloregulator ArsR/SmtB family transcription factor [Paenibacillus]MCY9659479.1 metalloregulator ArsR/SmtB family transcription factor [Paenibacillus anseongense]MEB4796874.1 metalloregulator ArsR/SmtB family transcription factor [Paenibacillus chondroitinus]